MKKDSRTPIERASDRTANTLRAARELAEHAFENPSERTVMTLFADISRNLEEIEAAEEVATLPEPAESEDDPADSTLGDVQAHTVH